MGFALCAVGNSIAAEDAREVRAPVSRGAEFVLATILFVLTMPVILFAALTIMAASRSTPFVAHRRAGQCGRLFWMWKLRTMWGQMVRPAPPGLVEYIDEGEIPTRKSMMDARIGSRFAAFCRRYSIDELPQFVHVIGGTMALVGPRPLTAKELELHYGPAAAEVLRVRPGLTGLWQVRGRNRLTYRQRKRYDLFLVRRWSARLYWRILAHTLRAVLSGRDAF